MAEHDAADREHLPQISQAQLVAQPSEHHDGDDIGRILCPIQHAAERSLNCLTQARQRKRLGGGSGRFATTSDPHSMQRTSVHSTREKGGAIPGSGIWREP
jgi:hypothetical protein